MNTACPSCGTAYAVTPADAGRRIACAKCGLVMVVDATGLRPDAPASPAPAVTARFAGRLPVVDRPTALFAVGAVLVVAFAVMPLIAAARVDRQNALLGEAALEHAAGARALRESGADDQRLRDHEEKWQKRRDLLQDDIRRAEFARGRAAYWDRYGFLFGAVLLAVGAVGLVRGDYPTAARAVAGVVLTALVLLAVQTVLPAGCAPAGRLYNPGGPFPGTRTR